MENRSAVELPEHSKIMLGELDQNHKKKDREKRFLNDRHSLFMGARGVCLNGVKFLVIERDELFDFGVRI